MNTVNTKLNDLYHFFLDRLGEPSTWQGIGFIVALFTSRYQGMDWGQGAAVGGFVSALIKTVTKG